MAGAAGRRNAQGFAAFLGRTVGYGAKEAAVHRLSGVDVAAVLAALDELERRARESWSDRTRRPLSFRGLGQAQNAATAAGSPTNWSMLRTRLPSRVTSTSGPSIERPSGRGWR